MLSWAGGLASAQLNAITEVGLDKYSSQYATPAISFMTIFPALKRLYISETALTEPRSKSLKDKAADIRRQFKLQDEEIEVIFYWLWERGTVSYRRYAKEVLSSLSTLCVY